MTSAPCCSVLPCFSQSCCNLFSKLPPLLQQSGLQPGSQKGTKASQQQKKKTAKKGSTHSPRSHDCKTASKRPDSQATFKTLENPASKRPTETRSCPRNAPFKHAEVAQQHCSKTHKRDTKRHNTEGERGWMVTSTESETTATERTRAFCV